MGEIGRKVILRLTESIGQNNESVYRVYQVKNSTEWPIGMVLCKEAVNAILKHNPQVEVSIKGQV